MGNKFIDEETLQYLDDTAQIIAEIRELEGYSEPESDEQLAITKLGEAYMLCYSLLLDRINEE